MYGAEPLLPPVRSASPALSRAATESPQPWSAGPVPPAVSRVTSMLPPALSPKIGTVQRRSSIVSSNSPPTPTNRASSLPLNIAQRCQAILSHTIAKLGLVDSLFQMYNQYLVDQKDGADAALTLARAQNKGEGMFFAPDSSEGDEILGLILMQRQLQTEYSDLMANREAFRANNDRSAFAQNEIQLKAITSSLREVSGRVYEKLKLLDLHIAATVGPKYHTQANDIASSLQQVAGQLDHGRFDSLFMQLPPQFLPASVMRSVQSNKPAGPPGPSGTTTPSPRQSARGEAKTTAVEEAVGQLQDEIARERADFERQTAHKNETIHALTEELRRVRSEVESAVKYERDTEEARLETRARMRRKDLSELTAKLQQAQRDLDLDGSVHQLSMDFLGRRRNTMEKEAQFWESKYNEEHGALVHQLQDLQAQRDRDYGALEELRERWHRMQAENQAAAVERAKEEERRAAQTKLDRIFYIAQTRIRLAWRCFRRRKQKKAAKLAAKKKKKGGAKKDGKGRPGTTGRPKSAK